MDTSILNSNLNIVHVIYREKFTLGYIRFMEYYFPQYSHTFITFSQEDDSDYIDNDVILLKKLADISQNKEIKMLFSNADKIIATGIFGGIQKYLKRCGSKVLSKTYFQFWGGDFYRYRLQGNKRIRLLLNQPYSRYALRYCIKHGAGVINLIPTDWNELYKIFQCDVKHFVAPMGTDPNKRPDYEAYRRNSEKNVNCRILIGNSATSSNCHLEAFEKLKKFASEKIELVVPLSYGDTEKYRESVIKNGTEIFGSKFHPILNYIEKTEYISLLNSCDIGIFNNDRQQGMGNINMMFSLGKKVFARRDTAMGSYFEGMCLKFYDINDIPNMEFEEFKSVDESVIQTNINIQDERRRAHNGVELWKKIFEDKI